MTISTLVMKQTQLEDRKEDDGTAKLFVKTEPHSVHVTHSNRKIVDCDRIIRLGFIRKVYCILSIQLLATAFICYFAMTSTGDSIAGFKILTLGSVLVSSRALFWLIFVVTFVLLVALLCFKDRYPVNYYLLAVWTIAISLSIATACANVVCDPMMNVVEVNGTKTTIPMSLVTMVPNVKALDLYDKSIQCAVGTENSKSGSNAVLMAVGMTAAIFVGLTVFTFQSKWDFSFLGVGLGSCLILLIIWGCCLSIFGSNSILRYLYSLLGSIIFSLYIIFDTWKIIQVYTPDDYILAVIDLYLDVINLFIHLLQLFADRN